MATDCNGWGLTYLVSLSPIVEGQSASKESMEVTGGQEQISDPLPSCPPSPRVFKLFSSAIFSGVYYQSSNTLCDETVLGVYNLSDCQAAATSLNLSYYSSFSSSYWPKGCFAYPQPNPRNIYMNTHNTGCCTGGETNANAKQICKSGNTLQLTILKFIFE